MKYELGYLLTLFGTPEYDWLNFKVTDENPITFHHIKSVSEGGEDLVTNGALLTFLGHRYLHEIEKLSPFLFSEISLFLKEVNNRRYPPTKDELLLIEEELLNYEQQHYNKLKRIIKLKNINEKKLLPLFNNPYQLHPTNIRLNFQQGIYIYKDNYLKNIGKGKQKKKYRNSSYTSG